MSGKTERYTLTTPTSEYVLPGTTMPTQLANTEAASQLVRAYGYREVYDLSDPYANPADLVLTIRLGGDGEFANEDDLALALRELRTAVRTATAVTRNDRVPVPVRRGRMVVVPDGDDSTQCVVTVKFTPNSVPDEENGMYDW